MEITLSDLATWLRTLEWVESIVFVLAMILPIFVGMFQRTWYNWRMSDEEREQVEGWRRGPFRLRPSQLTPDR